MGVPGPRECGGRCCRSPRPLETQQHKNTLGHFQGPAWWPLTAGLQQEGAGGGSDRGPSWSQHLERERERERSADEKKRF